MKRLFHQIIRFNLSLFQPIKRKELLTAELKSASSIKKYNFKIQPKECCRQVNQKCNHKGKWANRLNDRQIDDSKGWKADRFIGSVAAKTAEEAQKQPKWVSTEWLLCNKKLYEVSLFVHKQAKWWFLAVTSKGIKPNIIPGAEEAGQQTV